MDRFLHLPLFSFNRANALRILASVWICGLLSGAAVSLCADEFLPAMMLAALSCDVSIFGLLIAILLPLLISFFAVYISQIWLLIPIVFVKAFLFSYTGVGILQTFNASGWLIRILFMFGDSLALPFLWWYWLQVTASVNVSLLRGFLPALLCAVVAGCIDYCYVAPFLAGLI